MQVQGVVRRFRLTLIASAAALAGSLAFPAASPGAVTIGSNLQNAPTLNFNCNPSQQCTERIATLASQFQAAGGITSPINGVVVRWRIRVGTNTGPVTFRIVRPAGVAGQFTGAGTAPSAVTPSTNATTPYDVRMPIQAGDSIGLNCCQNGDITLTRAVGVGEGSFQTWGTGANSALADGEPPRAADFVSPDKELTINADVEADADGDGYGDETQDQCPTDASTQGPCPVSNPPSNDFEIGELNGKKLTLTVAGPGEVEVIDAADQSARRAIAAAKKKRLKPSSATASGGGTVTVKLKLTKSANKKLKKKGKVKVNAAITFTPTGGSANTETAKLKVKK